MTDRKPPYNCPEYRPGRHAICLECGECWSEVVHDHLRGAAVRKNDALDHMLFLSGRVIACIGYMVTVAYGASDIILPAILGFVALLGGLYLVIEYWPKGKV